MINLKFRDKTFKNKEIRNKDFKNKKIRRTEQNKNKNVKNFYNLMMISQKFQCFKHKLINQNLSNHRQNQKTTNKINEKLLNQKNKLQFHQPNQTNH